MVDDVRNFLFGEPGSGGFDLASLNIQRGRDHGLLGYNDVREAHGLTRAQGFEDVSSDPKFKIGSRQFMRVSMILIFGLAGFQKIPCRIHMWVSFFSPLLRTNSRLSETETVSGMKRLCLMMK